jgi:membrane associated rhomboid family serine protease
MNNFNHYNNRGTQITPVVRDLLIINILFFVGTSFSDDVAMKLALYYPTSSNFRPFQFATHFFMHANLFHLFMNMIGLYSLGVMLEMVWGGKRFLAYYFMCAFGASLAHLAMIYFGFDAASKMIDPAVAAELGMRSQIDIPMVGASGAIYGLLAAIWYLFPDVAFYVYFIPVPIKAKYLVPVLILSDLFFGFSRFGGDNVAHFAHVGGAFVGLIILVTWYKKSMF